MRSPWNGLLRSQRGLYTLYGALFGLCFPLIATLVRAGGLQGARMLAVQGADPLLWIIDSAPFWLGLFARLAGIRQDRLRELVDTLDGTVHQRTEELRAALGAQEQVAQARALLLSQMSEGLVMLDAEGRMAAECSLALRQLLGPYRPGTHFWDYLSRHDAPQGQMFRLGFEVLQEGLLGDELALEQLPRRLTAGARRFRVDYRLVPSPAGRGLLVVLRDVTAELARERLEEERREMLAIVDRLLHDRSAFRDFLQDGDGLVQRLLGRAARGMDGEGRRLLHTLKGNSAVWGLSRLSGLCHELEDQIATGEAPDLLALERAWGEIVRKFGALAGYGAVDRFEVQLRDHEELLGAISRGEGPQSLLERARALRLQRVRSKLEPLGAQARALSQRLGRGALQIDLQAGDLRVPGERFADFFAALTHVVRNAVDHGLPPEDEQEREPVLRLAAAQQGDCLLIEVGDNGRGIDWERLRERAARQGLPAVTRADLVAALLSDGVSTRDEVSELSGRGVGMAAVRAACDALGGTIDVESEPGQGTRWRFRLPLGEAPTPTPSPSWAPRARSRAPARA